MKSNIEQLKIAEKHLGEGCRKCCYMASNCCCYFVCKIFREADNASLFYGGQWVTYCPTAIKWCQANLAEIPLYIAMPSDVIFFDWNGNGVPDHIGFVRDRVSATKIATIEGNTSGGIVAYKTRVDTYVQGIFRPHFVGKYDLAKPLAIDGQCGYDTIAFMQKWLGLTVDGILGRGTVKALQTKLGVTADGAWGVNTSKALQRLIGVTADGYFGIESVMALQKFLNQMVKTTATPTTPIVTAPTTNAVRNLDVDGIGGKATVTALQNFLGCKEDGVISGQKKSNKEFVSALTSVAYGDGGSATVRQLQRWLGITQDGSWGKGTSKALQKKLGVKADGYFGTNSMKALQKYLNANAKAVYPPTTAIGAKAKQLAWAIGTPKSKYAWDGGSATKAFKLAIDKVYPNHNKWSEAPREGACCDVFVGTVIRASGVDKNYPRGFDEQIKYTSDKLTKLVYKNVAPIDVIKDGDAVLYTKNASGTDKHTLIYADGVIYEAQYEKTYGHVNKSLTKLKTKRPKVVIFRAK